MPIPSGSIRISSSSPPGRSVGLMQPTTPRQLVNAMMVSFVSLYGLMGSVGRVQ